MLSSETKTQTTLRTLLLLICVKLAAIFTVLSSAAEAPAPALARELPQVQQDLAPTAGLSLASTNSQVLLDVVSRGDKPLVPGGNDKNVAKLVARILVQNHYLQQPLDNAVANKFLDRYVEVLDNLHMHFVQSDLTEFDKYRAKLDDQIYKEGDTAPAREIFTRFLQRLEQRVKYVAELLQTEHFEFTGDDRYNLNRKDAARPKDLAEAKQIWRQHLRYEILQEKLNKEKPEEIAKKITRRYARVLRMYQDLDNGDIFEIYLSALTHVYDPHSDYMGKSSLETFSINMSLSLFGIGALLQAEDGYCKIKELVPGGPAAQSKKLKPNDRIIAVAQGDGETVDVIDTPLKKVVDMIRGPKGTVVNLTIIPADAADPSNRKVITLVRDEIKLEDQEAKAKVIDMPGEQDKHVRLGVIDLPSFYASFDRKVDSEPKSTTVDVTRLLRKLKREKVDGIILDLRRNGGGSLEEAINLTGLFIKEGPVVQVKDYNGKVMVDSDTDPSVVYDGPLIVLTSRFSASASEILAGALQDYGRALIVGDSSTHGKGTVQSLIKLDPFVPKKTGRTVEPPGAVKLTIRKFYRASGASTQLKGVVPDMVLPSPSNYAEVGEASLDNPLPWDTIHSASYEKLNLIQPILPELQKRSGARLATDQDFIYLREDIEQYRKLLADKTVSLNEQQRLKEKTETEAKQKARQTELKTRPESGETVYELTLKQTELPGLPLPMSKTNEVTSASAPHSVLSVDNESIPDHPAVPSSSTKWSVKTNDVSKADASKGLAVKDDDDEDSGAETKVPPVDATLKEAKRILVDLISLWSRADSVAVSN
jgi:carboxyl-terminal processing protease